MGGSYKKLERRNGRAEQRPPSFYAKRAQTHHALPTHITPVADERREAAELSLRGESGLASASARCSRPASTTTPGATCGAAAQGADAPSARAWQAAASRRRQL